MVEIFFTNGRRLKRKPLLLWSTVLLFFLWSVIFYGSFIEPRFLSIREEVIDVEGLSAPLRVAVLSDLHVGPYKGLGWVEKAVKKTNEQSPEIIFLLGDYVMGSAGKLSDLSPLADLRAPFGIYAILGNHDYDNNRDWEIYSRLSELGITVLRNETVLLSLSDGSTILLSGLADWWNDADLEKTLTGLSDEETVILLSHNPDAVLSTDSAASDLILSGHSHGGQITLPLFGPVAFVPTRLGRNFSDGLFLINNEKVFVTSGLGETGPRARLFNPPEIVILELN